MREIQGHHDALVLEGHIYVRKRTRKRGKERILTDTQVSIDGGIAGGTGQVLILSVGDVEVGLGVAVLLRETKVNDIDLVATLADAHEEVVGLDIAMDEVTRVDVLNAGDLQ